MLEIVSFGNGPEALAWSCQTSAATKVNAGGNFAIDV